MGTSVIVPIIPNCDLCDRKAYADASIPGRGQWAYLCRPHFDAYKCSLGTGKGQQLLTEEALDAPLDVPFDDSYIEDIYQSWAFTQRVNGDDDSRGEFSEAVGDIL